MFYHNCRTIKYAYMDPSNLPDGGFLSKMISGPRYIYTTLGLEYSMEDYKIFVKSKCICVIVQQIDIYYNPHVIVIME